MIFSKTRPIKVVMIGTGGTGGHIAPHLYRLLYALDRPVKFILCDGDVVEEKNLVRQNFTAADLGENKAKVTRALFRRLRSGDIVCPGFHRKRGSAGAAGHTRNMGRQPVWKIPFRQNA